MERFSRLTDEQIDRLLSGRASSVDLQDLAGFAASVRAGLPETPDPSTESRHLAAIVEASAAFAPEGGAMPAPGRRQLGLRLRRRAMLGTVYSTLAAKIAVASVAAAAATGGLAATGSLPEPAQNAVSSAASHVGLHFPKKGAEASGSDATRHGETVSDTAGTTEKTGREKGQEISETARTNSEEHRKDAEHRPSDAPSGNPTGNGSQVRPSGNPTGFGKDAQPSGNPTGYGKDAHPSGNGEQPQGNPTGRGRP